VVGECEIQSHAFLILALDLGEQLVYVAASLPLGKRAPWTPLLGGWLRPSTSVGGTGIFCPSRISLHELTTPVILKKTVITNVVYYISEVPPSKPFEPGCVQCGMLIMSSDTIFSFQISVINNINKSIVQNYDVGVTNDRSLYGLNLCDGLW
jgi:hypothetical protein